MSDKSAAQDVGNTLVSEDIGVSEGYTDDISINYAGLLDHAPASSHGTYIHGINEGLESLEEYQEGGYHPIHLNDCLGAAGRYRVTHKLGHGGFGTVWLCRDTQEAKYVAIKVMIGDITPDQIPDLNLANLDHAIAGAEYLALPLDHFSLEGPNGTHQCIVLPVLGPCVSPRLWLRIEANPESVLRRMANQAVKAMRFLHNNGLCHGGKSSSVFVIHNYYRPATN